MNKVHRKVEYALMALKHIEKKGPGELTTAKEISEVFHISFDMTSRVLQNLAQKGWLVSHPGVGGGYSLNSNLQQESLHDLMEILVGETSIAKCLSNNEVCELSPKCNIVNPIQNLNLKLHQFYKQLSIKSLLSERETHV